MKSIAILFTVINVISTVALFAGGYYLLMLLGMFATVTTVMAARK